LRLTTRHIIATAFGVALLAGGGASALAQTGTPSSASTSLLPRTELSATWAPPTETPAPTDTPTSTASPTPTQCELPVPVQVPAQLRAPQQPTEKEIRDLFNAWNSALIGGDAAKIADLYAPGAILLPTKSDEVRTTRDGIIAYFKDFLKDKPCGKIKDGKVEILGPDGASHSGVYVFSTKDGDVPARFTFVYKRIDGKWYIIQHHSSKMPEAKK
jgi:uncharacterized protein (TIGR02246 family)